MRLLLDTNALLWWLAEVRLSEAARTAIATADEVLVSAVSGYEIGFKRTIGKLEAPDDVTQRLDEYGFLPLPLSLRHAVVAGDLPLRNRDPFDRLLVAQARCEGLTLVTADRKLAAYEVSILDATE